MATSNNIKSKASAINFGGPSVVHADGERKKKTETAPGMMADVMLAESVVLNENKALHVKNEELKGQVASYEGTLPSRRIDPKLIKASKWANRHELSFTGTAFDALKDEIDSAGGNVQPIKVRPILGTSPQEYEIVFGHRRHMACLLTNNNVLAMVESIDDKNLFKEMDRENRQRADLRPYEQGLMYARALDEGLFSSQRKLAEDLGLQSSNVSTAINIARLPKDVIDAFSSPLDIQFRWAAPLNEALKADPDLVLARAKEIKASRMSGVMISAPHVYDKLIGIGDDVPKTVSHFVKLGGKAAFKVSVSKDKVSIDLPTLSKAALSKVEKAILEALKE